MSLSSEAACAAHLVRITWFQIGLFVLGTLAWTMRSSHACWTFVLTGVVSILFWHLHQWLVTRVLAPNVRWRLVFGLLIIVKLALLVLALRGIIDYFPMEVIPFTTGIMLFSAPVLVEAIYLIFWSGPDVNL